MNFCSRNFICLYDVKESDGIVLLHLSCLWWAINFLHGHEIWDGNCVVIARSGRLVFNNWNDMIHVDNFVLIWDLNFNITRNKRSRPLLIFSNSFKIKSSFSDEDARTTRWEIQGHRALTKNCLWVGVLEIFPSKRAENRSLWTVGKTVFKG